MAGDQLTGDLVDAPAGCLQRLPLVGIVRGSGFNSGVSWVMKGHRLAQTLAYGDLGSENPAGFSPAYQRQADPGDRASMGKGRRQAGRLWKRSNSAYLRRWFGARPQEMGVSVSGRTVRSYRGFTGSCEARHRVGLPTPDKGGEGWRFMTWWGRNWRTACHTFGKAKRRCP